MSMSHRRKIRPQLECLEGRLAPAKFTVTTKLDVVDENDGRVSLREAIDSANHSQGTDTIILGKGVHLMQLAGTDSNNVNGDFDIHSGSLTIRGAGAGKSVIDAQQIHGVFQVIGSSPSSIRVTFQGLTIRNGFRDISFGGGGILFSNADLVVRDSVISGNRTSGPGGGISNAYGPGTGNVTLIRSTVTGNVAGPDFDDSGGGVFLDNSQITLRNSTVRRNLVGGAGGGIRAHTATLFKSTVSGNTAGDEGGGIRCTTATITNSTVSGNTAITAGGGISANTATLTNSTVSGNSAGNGAASNGGGIYAGTANLTNSTVSGNTAGGDGGGINAGTANLTNSTVSGNTAAGSGGGIRTSRGNLLNATIVENIAANGGGIVHSAFMGWTVSAKNTLIALNLVSFNGTGPDVNGVFTSQGNNLIGDGSGGTGFLSGGVDQIGTSVNPIDPRIGPLRNNGGRTQTHALLAGSKAIDKGDNNTVDPISGETLKTDQRGTPFKRRFGSRVDIGAFEQQ